jgi:hypothetical protein
MWWISGRHVIFYVSIFPFIVSVRLMVTDIWRSPPINKEKAIGLFSRTYSISV